ncbi:MAG: universal stress protein [Neomegalonema sp.]|nr:universal stress protein [Neomegalonema sp.]
MDERKFLVVVDQTAECLKALRFAARRAERTGGGVSMLFVIEPDSFQHWQLVADRMRDEAHQEAEERLLALSEEVKSVTGVSPDYMIREGKKNEAVLAHIEENPNVRILVLGAGTETEGPGPLVTALAGKLAGRMKVPVTIVPGAMSLEEIDALC